MESRRHQRVAFSERGQHALYHVALDRVLAASIELDAAAVKLRISGKSVRADLLLAVHAGGGLHDFDAFLLDRLHELAPGCRSLRIRPFIADEQPQTVDLCAVRERVRERGPKNQHQYDRQGEHKHKGSGIADIGFDFFERNIPNVHGEVPP